MTDEPKTSRGAIKKTAKRRAYRARRRERDRSAEVIGLADEAAQLAQHARTENFLIHAAEMFILKVEPVLRRLAAEGGAKP